MPAPSPSSSPLRLALFGLVACACACASVQSLAVPEARPSSTPPPPRTTTTTTTAAAAAARSEAFNRRSLLRALSSLTVSGNLLLNARGTNRPALALKPNNEALCGTGFFTNIAQYKCTDIGDISDEGRSRKTTAEEDGRLDGLMAKFGDLDASSSGSGAGAGSESSDAAAASSSSGDEQGKEASAR